MRSRFASFLFKSCSVRDRELRIPSIIALSLLTTFAWPSTAAFKSRDTPRSDSMTSMYFSSVATGSSIDLMNGLKIVSIFKIGSLSSCLFIHSSQPKVPSLRDLASVSSLHMLESIFSEYRFKALDACRILLSCNEVEEEAAISLMRCASIDLPTSVSIAVSFSSIEGILAIEVSACSLKSRKPLSAFWRRSRFAFLVDTYSLMALASNTTTTITRIPRTNPRPLSSQAPLTFWAHSPTTATRATRSAHTPF